MPTDESKLYVDLKSKLENLSGGVSKHSSEPEFPQNITKAVIDEKTANLVATRKLFDEASNIAHQKFEEYEKIFNECSELFSNISTQLYGAYGKQNRIVEDYGLKIYKKHLGRKPKSNKVTN